MEKNQDTIENFMGIFPNAASKEYCDKVINRFDYMQETQSAWTSGKNIPPPPEGVNDNHGRGKVWSRQEGEQGIPTVMKENDTYFLGGTMSDHLPVREEDVILMSRDMSLLREFNQISMNCYNKYKEKYGILSGAPIYIDPHKISPSVRIQKYNPGQGYHVWHCDSSTMTTSRRIVVIALYLNTVEEGGETEFLYQKRRIPPIQGTLVLCPAAWTHTHRGNPPLKGNKYLLTSWLELMDT